MSMYSLIEYSDVYLKTSGSLWLYYRDEPALENGGTKDVEIMVPLKYQSNFLENI